MQCTPCSQTLYPDKYSQFQRLSLLRMTRRVVIPGDEIERRITELLSFIWRERSLDKTEGPVLEREESKYRLKRSIDNWKTKWWFSVTILVSRRSIFSLSAMDRGVSPWRWPKGSRTFILKNWFHYLRIDTFFFIETLIREFLEAALDGTRDSSCLVA